VSWSSRRPLSQTYSSRISVPRRSTLSSTHTRPSHLSRVVSDFSIAVTCLFAQPAESRIQVASLESLLFFAKNRLPRLSILQIFTLGVLGTTLSARQSCFLYWLTVVQLVNKFPAVYAIRGFIIVFRGARHWVVSTARPFVTQSSS
jgi:hypothetical protein